MDYQEFNMKKYVYALVFLLVTAGSASAQIERRLPPPAGPAPEIKLGTYETFKLKNELQVFVIENHKLPRISLALAFRLDPVLEGKDAGYIMLTGELLRTGTATRNKAQIDEAVDMIGASLVTSADFIYASALKKHFKVLLDLFADVTLQAKFTEEELNKLKKQTLSGIAFSKDKPDMIAGRLRRILSFGDAHPYGDIMTEESVKKITLELCENYYKNYFSPDHAYLAVVGDITLGEVRPLVQAAFDKWEVKQVPFHQYKMPKAPENRTVALVDRPNAVQSTIVISYPIRLKLGSANQVKAEVLNQILGGGSTGRLFLNLREEKGFTYGAYSNLEADPLVGYFSASTEVRNSATDSAVTEILGEMNKLCTEKVGNADLQLAKNYLSGEFARSLEDPQTIAQFALDVERYWMPKDYYLNYLKNIEAVTAEDVQEMAKKYLTPENAYVIVVGKGDEIGEKLKSFSSSSVVNLYSSTGELFDPQAFKAPEGITAQQIIEKYIGAIGGRARLEKVKTIMIKAQTGIRGQSVDVTIMKKAPNKLMQKMEAGNFVQKTIFDGTRGVSSGAGRTIEIVGDNLEALKFEAQMNSITQLEKLWIETKLIGEETINDRPTYKIRFNPKIGKSWTANFDKQNGLQVKQEREADTPNGPITQITEYDDYRAVDGILFPFEITQTVSGQEIGTNVIFINVNEPIEDWEFDITL